MKLLKFYKLKMEDGSYQQVTILNYLSQAQKHCL